MEKLFRHMGARKALVICLVLVCAAYVVGSLGVDLSCGPDELVSRAVRSVVEEDPPAPTPTAAPSPTPITTARWALVETLRSLGSVSSARFEVRVSGSNVLNRGLVVRPSLAELEVVSARSGEVAAMVRLVDDEVYIAGPDDPENWLRALDTGDLGGLMHIDPRWPLTRGEGFESETDSEIVMDGSGEVWYLSGLVSPGFTRSTGFSWDKVGARDYPVQYIMGVDAASFLPSEITLAPYPGSIDIRMNLSEYDVAAELPQAPQTAEADAEAVLALVSEAVARIARDARAPAEAAGEDAEAPEVVEPAAVSVVDADLPPVEETLWSESASERAGWRRFDVSELDLSIALPETWRMSFSNGSVFLNAEGMVMETGMNALGESLVGSVSSLERTQPWAWLAWDALSGGSAIPFVLLMDRDYVDLPLSEAAAAYRATVIESNSAVTSEVVYSTFVSGSGAVCAMGRYLVDLGYGPGHSVSDCLFATADGYVSITVGVPDAELSELVMETVR